MIIRILTEDKNHLRVRELCAKRFDAFTILHGMGCWKGTLEPALTIEIAIEDGYQAEREKATELAQEIKKLNDQEAVLIEYIESTNVLI
jgi:hypothetical protein